MGQGGGKFIGKDGRVQQYFIPPEVSSKELVLPQDALPGADLGRQLEHITINADCMDEDIKAALFDDFDSLEDSNGASIFEELQDDFIQVADIEPEVPDFDFDAHW